MEAILYKPSEESILSKTFEELIEKIEPFLPKDPQSFNDLYHGKGIYGFLPDWGKHVDNVIDNVKDYAVDWWDNFEISDYVDEDSLFFTVLSSVTTSSLELAALYLVARYVIIPVGKEIISYCINNIDFDSILNNIQMGIKNTKEVLISAKNKVIAIKDKIVDSLCKTTKKVKTFFVKTKDVLTSAFIKTKEYIKEKAEKAKAFVDNAKEYVKEKYDSAKEYVKGKYDKAKEYVKEKYEDAKEYVKEKYENTKEYVKDKVEKAKNWFKKWF